MAHPIIHYPDDIHRPEARPAIGGWGSRTRVCGRGDGRPAVSDMRLIALSCERADRYSHSPDAHDFRGRLGRPIASISHSHWLQNESLGDHGNQIFLAASLISRCHAIMRWRVNEDILRVVYHARRSWPGQFDIGILWRLGKLSRRLNFLFSTTHQSHCGSHVCLDHLLPLCAAVAEGKMVTPAVQNSQTAQYCSSQAGGDPGQGQCH